MAPAALAQVQKLEQPPPQAPNNVKIKPWTVYGSYPHLSPIVVAATFQAIAFVSKHLEPLQSASKCQETRRATLALAADGATINDEDAIIQSLAKQAGLAEVGTHIAPCYGHLQNW